MIQLQEKINTVTDSFSRRLVYDDELISVYVIDHAGPGDPSIGKELDDQLPDSKCYRAEGTKPHEWSERWKTLIPYGMVYVKGTDIFYDFGPQSHLMHDTNFSNKDNSCLTAVDIRKTSPNIEYFFDLEALASMFSRMPVLGAHFNLDSIRSAYLESLKEFRLEIEMAAALGEINLETHRFYNDFCLLTDRDTDSGLHVILAQVLNDELIINLGLLCNSMQLGLTLEVMENQTQRSRVLKHAVDSWIEHSQFYRISKKILKQDHELCISLLRQHLVRFFQSKLSQAIYQVIEK